MDGLLSEGSGAQLDLPRDRTPDRNIKQAEKNDLSWTGVIDGLLMERYIAADRTVIVQAHVHRPPG